MFPQVTRHGNAIFIIKEITADGRHYFLYKPDIFCIRPDMENFILPSKIQRNTQPWEDKVRHNGYFFLLSQDKANVTIFANVTGICCW